MYSGLGFQQLGGGVLGHGSPLRGQIGGTPAQLWAWSWVCAHGDLGSWHWGLTASSPSGTPGEGRNWGAALIQGPGLRRC